MQLAPASPRQGHLYGIEVYSTPGYTHCSKVSERSVNILQEEHRQ